MPAKLTCLPKLAYHLLKLRGMGKGHKKAEVFEGTYDLLRETHADEADFTPAEASAVSPVRNKRLEIFMTAVATTSLIGFLITMWLALP